MASRIEYAVSVTPIVTIAAGTEYNAVDVIAKDVGKTLSASGRFLVTWGSTVGFAAGVATPVVCVTGGTSLGLPGTNIKGVWVRHTGYTSGTLVTPTTELLTLTIGGTDVIFAELYPDCAIFVPFCGGWNPTMKGWAASGTIAAEVMATA